MDTTAKICAISLSALQQGVEMADSLDELPPTHPLYLSPQFLVPEYLRSLPACPSKGSYWLLGQPDGGYLAVCTVHTPREKVMPLILDTFICRILQYVDDDFVMVAQGKRTGISELLRMCAIYPLSTAWKAYSEGHAVDCSALAVEAMRDALGGLFPGGALLPDAGARTLGHLSHPYAYTEVISLPLRPSAMEDPTLLLQPGDICIVTPGVNMAHTTVYLGPYRKASGDATPYWIWASDAKKKIAVFTHQEYRDAFGHAPAETVARWKLKDYRP